MSRSVDDRLQRLTGLARVWGDLYLFHPALAAPDIRWEQRLPAAIEAVEAAETPAEYADALNRTLLHHLDDPLTFATTTTDPTPAEARTHKAWPTGRPPSARLLNHSDGAADCSLGALGAGRIGYLDVGDLDAREHPDILERLGSALDRVREAAGIVVDLRQAAPEPDAWYRSVWPDAFGFFLDTPLRLPGWGERVHQGWNEGDAPIYWSHWEHRHGDVLMPVRTPNRFLARRFAATDLAALPRYDGPLAVLVDDPAWRHLQAPLSALRMAGRAYLLHESVIGAPTRGEPLSLWGRVNVWLRLHELVTGRGRVEPSADRTLPVGRSAEIAVEVAVSLLRKGTPLHLTETPLVVAEPPAYQPSAQLQDGSPMRTQRLLGLFKLWCVLGEFAPHLEYADHDWPQLLATSIPRVEAASSGVAWCGVLKELAAGLNDSHVHVTHPDEKAFLAETYGGWTVPVAFRPIGDRVVVDAVDAVDPACELDLPVGAEVSQLDGQPVAAVLARCARHVSASTPQSRARQAARLLGRGAHGTVAELTVVADGGTRTLALPRTVEAGPGVLPQPPRRPEPVAKMAEFGYVDLVGIRTETEVAQAFETLGDCPGLILDIRGYPTCQPRASVVPRLIRTTTDSAHYAIPLRSGTRRAPDADDDWAASHWAADHYRLRPDTARHYAGPVAVLVDERAVSQSEDFCICLRNAGRAVFVGSGTAGTNGNVTWVHLPGETKLSFTGMRATYADGGRFQNVGIVPDLEVHPTPEGIRAGRDEVLEAAVEVLCEQERRAW